MTITSITAPPATAGEQDQDGHRAAYIAGLRELAATLQACPGLPLPFDGRIEPLTFTFHFLAAGDPAAAMAAAAAAIGVPWRTETRDYTGAGGLAYFDLLGELHGLRLRLTAYRDEVCEQVAAGDEQAWRCHPALAQAAGDGRA
jgi:hypothetical protein